MTCNIEDRFINSPIYKDIVQNITLDVETSGITFPDDSTKEAHILKLAADAYDAHYNKDVIKSKHKPPMAGEKGYKTIEDRGYIFLVYSVPGDSTPIYARIDKPIEIIPKTSVNFVLSQQTAKDAVSILRAIMNNLKKQDKVNYLQTEKLKWQIKNIIAIRSDHASPQSSENFVNNFEKHLQDILRFSTGLNNKQLDSSFEEVTQYEDVLAGLEMIVNKIDYAFNTDITKDWKSKIDLIRQNFTSWKIQNFSKDKKVVNHWSSWMAMLKTGFSDSTWLGAWLGGITITKNPVLKTIQDKMYELDSKLQLRFTSIKNKTKILKDKIKKTFGSEKQFETWLLEKNEYGQLTGYVNSEWNSTEINDFRLFLLMAQTNFNDQFFEQIPSELKAYMHKRRVELGEKKIYDFVETFKRNYRKKQSDIFIVKDGRTVVNLEVIFKDFIDFNLSPLDKAKQGKITEQYDISLQLFTAEIIDNFFNGDADHFARIIASHIKNNTKGKKQGTIFDGNILSEFNNSAGSPERSTAEFKKVISSWVNMQKKDPRMFYYLVQQYHKTGDASFLENAFAIYDPKLHTISFKHESFKNKEFIEQLKDPAKKEIYDEYVQRLEETRKKIPPIFNDDGSIDRLERLPSFQKSIVEEFHSKGATAFMKKAPKMLEELVKEVKQQSMDIADAYSELALKKKIPFFGWHKFDESKDSTNALELLNTAESLAASYEHLHENEGFFIGAQEFIKRIPRIKKVNGEIKKFSNEKLENDLEKLENFINGYLYYDFRDKITTAFVYNESKDPNYLHTKQTKIQTIKDLEEELEHVQKTGETTVKNGQIRTEEVLKRFIKVEKRDLAKFVQAHSDKVSLEKVGDITLKTVAATALAGNFISALSEISFGFTSNIVGMLSWGEKSGINIFKALGLAFYLKAAKIFGDKREDFIVKIFNLDSLAQEMTMFNGDSASLEHKLLNEKTLYLFSRQADLINKMPLAIYILQNYKLEHNGKVFSVWDAINEDSSWNEDLYGPSIFVEGNEHFELLFKKINAAASEVHGMPYQNDNAKIKRYLLGRALFQFKTWIPRSINKRLGGTMFSGVTEDETKGYWLTFYEAMTGSVTEESVHLTRKDRIWQNLKWLMFVGDTYLTDREKSLVRAAIFDIGFCGILMSMAYHWIKSSQPDDEDDSSKAIIALIIGLINRVQNDATFFANPTSYIQLGKNSWPVARWLTDVGNLFEVTFQTITGSEKMFYEAGPHKGELELPYRFARVVPLAAQYVNVQNFIERQLRGE